MTRNPRIDPKPGDVLTLPIGRYEVTKASNRKVWFNFTQPGVRHIMYNIPMACKDTLPEWRKRMRDAEVLHIAA
jgi:hypothetical protein